MQLLNLQIHAFQRDERASRGILQLFKAHHESVRLSIDGRLTRPTTD